MTKTMPMTVVILALFQMAATGVWAAHANPWAGDDDSPLSKDHDTNQEQSIDTTGDDEMKGVMSRTARGKLETLLGAGVAGQTSSQAASVASGRGSSGPGNDQGGGQAAAGGHGGAGRP